MLDIARSAPNELDMMMLARSDYERPPDMGVLDDMLAGFDALATQQGIPQVKLSCSYFTDAALNTRMEPATLTRQIGEYTWALPLVQFSRHEVLQRLAVVAGKD